jgi:hypothetical protein
VAVEDREGRDLHKVAVEDREGRGREVPMARHVGLEKGKRIDRQEERGMVNREDVPRAVPAAVPTDEVLVGLVKVNVVPNGDLEDPKVRGTKDPHQWHSGCKTLIRW